MQYLVPTLFNFKSVFTISLMTLLCSCNVTVEQNKTTATAVKQIDAVHAVSQLHKPVSPMPESFYQADADELKANFKTPPEAVKPWVYWYWINDHISKKGIEHDLAAMQEAGINTALIGIIHLNPKNGSYGKVSALSDEWWDHLRFAIEKADDYNIDIGLFNSPGWSQSGGPWVNLEQSMRYLDHKEYQVNGLSSPSHLTLNKPDGFSQDVKVIAFKTPKKEKNRLNTEHSKVTLRYLDNTDFNGKVLIDNDRTSVYHFPQALLTNTGSQLTIDFEHNKSLSVRSIEVFPHDAYSASATLFAKLDNGEFKAIESFKIQRPRNMASIGPDHDAPIVINFPKTTAREFRLLLNKFKLGRGGKDELPGIKEIVLSSGYKLERFVEKKLAKVHPTPQPKHDSYQWDKPLEADLTSLAINSKNVVDLTPLVNGNHVNWQVPEGNWTIVHYFMRSTGTTNGPSSRNAKGPEIDKLSKKIAQYHFDAYLGKILETMNPEQRRSLKYAVVDSYEQGAQNWTDGFALKFEQQYGYDPIPYLPVYTGRIVNSADQSERFLWDVRRMVADRVSYEYTAGLRERSHQHGLKLWLENYGHWGFPGEFLQYGGQADIVSGEFWASGNLGAIELKAASAAAHIYGHKTVMSESFTAGRGDAFLNHPWNFKKRGDWSFVEGINHTLLHVYIQQAYDNKFPGVNAWFGSEFNRNNTWFNYMGSWLDYIKRANYMMQQGTYIADIMYFIGEDAPKMTGELKPSVPAGYSYDFINAEVILNGLTVEHGQFVLASGMRFKLLVLPNLSTMRPAVLAKIKQLVAQGGSIYGPKPNQSPSLANYPEADQQVQQLADELWQQVDGQQVTAAQYGRGHIYYVSDEQVDLAKVMQSLEQPADLTGLPDEVIWSHRSSDTHEIYFIANQSEGVVDIKPSFRHLANMGQPQRWDAVTGDIYQIAQYQLQHNRAKVPMRLQGLESAFIVFEKTKAIESVKPISVIDIASHNKNIWLPSVFEAQGNIVIDIPHNGDFQIRLTNGRTLQLKVDDLPLAKVLTQPWQLTFEQNRDVPTELTLNKLASLTELDPLALKHYSGTVKYKTQFELTPNDLRDDQRWQLNLGEVGVIARVKVNGKEFGEVWSRPLTLDVSDALKSGRNQLVVEVANTWVNRLVGDLKYPKQFPDSDKPKQFETEMTFQSKVNKNTPLQPAGLIGPVTLNPVRKIRLELE